MDVEWKNNDKMRLKRDGEIVDDHEEKEEIKKCN